MTWFAGRGKSGANYTYVVKRRNIQSWVNRNGYLSLPASEVKSRIRKRHQKVMFFDLVSHTKFVTDADNFRNGLEEEGQVAVPIENFDVIYKRAGE